MRTDLSIISISSKVNFMSKLLRMKSVLLLLLCITSIGVKSAPKKIKVQPKNHWGQAKERSWKLVWKDDFSSSKLDLKKWSTIPEGKSDWNNYMSNNRKCYKLAAGKLHLRGIVNPDTTKDKRPFLTGGIWSKGKFAFQYGKVEIRAKLESAKGAWPAMWMLAEERRYGKYPRNGEIDIMEHLNFDGIIYQTTHSHYTLNLGGKHKPPHHGTAKIDTSKYNTFGMIWDPNNLIFTLNGVKTFTYPRIKDVDASQWPYDQPFFLLIDQQLGGAWVGKASAKDLPVEMIIDWVKVYQ